MYPCVTVTQVHKTVSGNTNAIETPTSKNTEVAPYSSANVSLHRVQKPFPAMRMRRPTAKANVASKSSTS